MSKVGFRTRKRGTPRQIGKKFPVSAPKKLPYLNLREAKRHARHVFGVRIHSSETDAGTVWIISKGAGKNRKWFTEDFDTPNEELLNIAKNFDKEWEARVGQYQVTPESERASEYFARRYPMMFRGGGKSRKASARDAILTCECGYLASSLGDLKRHIDSEEHKRAMHRKKSCFQRIHT